MNTLIFEQHVSLLAWQKSPRTCELFCDLPQSFVVDLLKRADHKWLDQPNQICLQSVDKKTLDFLMPLRDRLMLRPGIIIFRLGPEFTATELRLIYAFLSRIFGSLNDRYGYFFDVMDRGMDYTQKAIPVSMTNAETGYHTDSTAKNYFPDIVGLLCLVPADQGGDSLVANAANLYQYFLRNYTQLVPWLYEPLARDVITPGDINSKQTIENNDFPLFSIDSKGLVFRYMRYWIESAYTKLEIDQPEAITKTLDIIDTYFSKPENTARFKMQRGDMLYVNNRFLCHNRATFKDSGEPRCLVRSWINL